MTLQDSPELTQVFLLSGINRQGHVRPLVCGCSDSALREHYRTHYFSREPGYWQEHPNLSRVDLLLKPWPLPDPTEKPDESSSPG
jgi:hypothetical protein